MTRKPTPRPTPKDQTPAAPAGERIAKVLARSGVASRREAEKIIEAGRVSVNGRKIDSPALNVTAADRITVDGAPLEAPEATRVWLYHKPTGLVTTTKDEQGRPTIYDDLPEDLPRVMSVGRLDLNSEGLLLLTNDGELKRKLELPATGWVRKYRVRVKGNPEDATLAPLREGVVIDREKFQPMAVSLDRQQGANAWLTIGLREGKNREIRRAMESIGLVVNRLIRVSYGPFQLGTLKQGEVQELRPRVLREQLGLELEEPETTPARGPRKRPGKSGKPGAPRPERGTEIEAPTRRGKAGDPRRGSGPDLDTRTGKPARPARGAKPAARGSDKSFEKGPARGPGKAGTPDGKPFRKSAGAPGGRKDPPRGEGRPGRGKPPRRP
ncbi:pseudouridine synthase [Pseudooceanicola sp. CBS1P-1]|uniref:Pseudouridine synthase n=1 Tax=Pseudooceanicola albus TaxID=2692189 RepID=A0A6L7G0E6_9RHOB|nr:MULTISPECIES: pseudouridine synthase [Pseudooceanicola]MBT9382622.1 pseudouridine synthase [Pseudooceanicola endophyticus]MXN17162.1 pseudouridine synthase [Pseudooceanicola albus]